MRTFAVVVLLSVCLVWLMRDRRDPAPEVEPVASKAPAAGVEHSESAAARPLAELAEQPLLKQRVRELVASVEARSSEEQELAVSRLTQDILSREAEGELLPAESAYLQLSLLQALPFSAEEQKRRAQALLERYESASQEGWDRFNAREDAALSAYRQAEAELVRSAREQGVPAQALREQLQALRVEHFSQAGVVGAGPAAEPLQ